MQQSKSSCTRKSTATPSQRSPPPLCVATDIDAGAKVIDEMLDFALEPQEPYKVVYPCGAVEETSAYVDDSIFELDSLASMQYMCSLLAQQHHATDTSRLLWPELLLPDPKDAECTTPTSVLPPAVSKSAVTKACSKTPALSPQ